MNISFKKRHQRFVDELRKTVIRDDKSKKTCSRSFPARLRANPMKQEYRPSLKRNLMNYLAPLMKNEHFLRHG